MNKNVMILGAILLVIILGLVGFKLLGKSESLSDLANSSDKKEKMEKVSIKDILMSTVSLKCDIVDDEKKTTAYIKNGMVRADMTGDEDSENTGMIFKTDKVYIWNNTTLEGMTMDVPQGSIDDLEDKMGQGGDGYDDMVDSIEKYRQNCKNATVADSVFTPPANVKFSSITDMMKGTPTGAAIPTGVSKEQMEELMKKYNPQ